MKMGFDRTGAAELYHVFDSQPPERALFYTPQGEGLPARQEGDGLYSFDYRSHLPVIVRCPGCLPVHFTPLPGAIATLRCYPSALCRPPAGWQLIVGKAPPGALCFWPDPAFRVRRLSHSGPFRLKLNTRPAFQGGCLAFENARGRQARLITQKIEPDFYQLDLPAPKRSTGLYFGYLAQSDAQGSCAVAAPLGFLPLFPNDTAIEGGVFPWVLWE